MTKAEAYRVFGLLENQPITEDLIKNRYRILIKTYHPDNPRTGNEEMMSLINVAFEAIQTNRYDDEPGQDNFEEAYAEGHDTYDWNKDFNADDFMVDFDPFEFDSADFAYQYFSKENESVYEDSESEEALETDAESDYEYEKQERNQRRREDRRANGKNNEKKKKRKRNPFIYLLKGFGKLCKFFILCMCLACFAGAVAGIVLFGKNERGFIVAGGAVVMGILFILVYRFFSALIE